MLQLNIDLKYLKVHFVEVDKRGFFYLSATLIWTWLFWFTIAALGRTTQDLVGRVLYFVGGAGHSVVALAFLYLFETKQTRADFWRRLLKIRAVPKMLVLSALLLPVILNCLAILSTSVLEGKFAGLIPTYVAISQPQSLVIFFVLRFVLGPLPEEIGWRGYALEHLQTKYSPIIASLTVWLFWWLWHLPLYWINGTYQNQSGLYSEQFFVFAFGLLAESFLFTWLYNGSGKSILICILFHFSINATGELLILNSTADLHRLIWSWIAAIAITLVSTQGRRAFFISAPTSGGRPDGRA